ncbi:MAG: hypothetical protein HQ502_19915, partial [Alphaproteobacteria bacterium]|nr:hypothetical protein [Alphaproteobacteria bacterium]
QPGHSLRFIALPPAEDPDSLVRAKGMAAFMDLLGAAVPLSEMLWRMQVQGKNLETPEQLAGLRRDLRDLVGEIADSTVRAYYGEHFKTRLQTAFSPRPVSQQRQGGAQGFARRGGGGGGWRRGPLYTPPIPAHRGLGRGKNADSSPRERLLIAALLNHPELIHEVFEDVGELRLSNPELDNIRGAIIETATSGAPLDLEGLRDNLHNGAMADAASRVVAELTGPGIAKLDPFAHPEASLEAVIKGWTSVFRWHRLEDLRRDLEAATDDLGRDMTEEKLARRTALQEAVDAATAEAVGIEDA